jgi:putative transposase
MPEYPRYHKGFDYVGFHRYSLTFRTFGDSDHFLEQSHVDLVLPQILRSADENQCAIPTYCFMPDHHHLLVEGTREDADLCRFVTRAKQFSGFHFSRQTGMRLWQRYGFERILRDYEDPRNAVRYIINNPVRKGLVASPEEYPYWGSSTRSRDELLDTYGGLVDSVVLGRLKPARPDDQPSRVEYVSDGAKPIFGRGRL